MDLFWPEHDDKTGGIGVTHRWIPSMVCVLILLGGMKGSGATPLDEKRLYETVSKALDFLLKNQLRHGEFRTYASPDSAMRYVLHFDSSPFVTTFVLYSLDFVDDGRVHEITKKGLDFLLEEEEGSGLWRYWTSLNEKRIDPDLDDISCISFLLKRHGVRFGSNLRAIYRNRNGKGVFLTWIRDPGSTNPNDIDCVVNANVLLYLGENEQTRGACGFLRDVIVANRELESSVYYVDLNVIYYMISRALFQGVSCLESVQDTMTSRLHALQEPDGSFGNDLATASAVCALFNLGAPPDSMTEKAIATLLAHQKWDGSWPAVAFYAAREDNVWWGSEELTTAICIEALARYRSLTSAP